MYCRRLKLRTQSSEFKPIRVLWESSLWITKVSSILTYFHGYNSISCKTLRDFASARIWINRYLTYQGRKPIWWYYFLISGIPIKSSLDNATSVLYSGLIGQLTEKAKNVVREMVNICILLFIYSHHLAVA